ncbi:MAG: flagellin [SAR324 cluster bacterium]|nr:flagellin [SAR324 cluster bacterium]MBL7035232.1 flagellin [SAR324 cluster bacterium]
MSLRVNNNLSAMNAHRNVVKNSNAQSKTMEKLSSGLKINRAADSPAQLQISENLRAQSSGLRQAIDNSEMAVSLMQTAEGALEEVSSALIQARQLAVHAGNEGANDQNMLEADQSEINNILEQINRIATSTQYGHNFLLDGSRAGNGVTTGENLEFVDATTEAHSSGVGGYGITIENAATRATHSGSVALSQGLIDAGEQITVSEGGRTVNFLTEKGSTVEQTLNDLETAIADAGLSLDLIRPYPPATDGNTPQAITFRHKEFGSEHTFQVASNTAGLVSNVANTSVLVANGTDVAGEINGEEATGRGQILTGGPGADTAEGIQIRYTGDAAPPGGNAGTVTFSQNSLTFQVGADANQFSEISLRSIKTNDLGRGEANSSDFESLAQIKVLNSEQAQDAIRVIDSAIEQVNASRGKMGAFQKNNLESNLNYLRVAHENSVSSESVIRDADMAEEMATFTRNQIMMEASTSMLAQANQNSMTVLKLIG